MYIIDKNKDYYDFHSHIYGVDKTVTFDRRGSIIITNDNLIRLSCRYGWQYDRLHKDDKNFIILEVGNVQYLIILFDFIVKDNPDHYTKLVFCSMQIIKIFRHNRHFFDKPISIKGVNFDWRWSYKKGNLFNKKYKIENSIEEVIKRVFESEIELPILAKTDITSLIDGKEIWIELQSYIASLNNDKDISIPMTDVEKAEIHGFDKKTSFRNPIK